MDILDYEEAAEDDSIYHYGAVLDEEDDSNLLGAGVIEEVEYMQKSLKSSSLLYYMLKPSRLLTQGFENNRTAQEKLFKHMCNIGAWSEWRDKIRVVSSYPDVDSTKDQFRIINTTPLDCTTGLYNRGYCW